uniref:Mitochondrial ribosomal protein S18B n=1 Tax=Buteo japonicus TaxID=224669 RepID=A0A8C0HIU3_9AVES
PTSSSSTQLGLFLPLFFLFGTNKGFGGVFLRGIQLVENSTLTIQLFFSPTALQEYRVTYGNKPVWLGYRRNHKGAIPPQRTRKACLNVKLLNQFICPHSGVIFHPTHTGLLWLQAPYVPVPRDDFSNQHPAVGKTPPAPVLAPGRPWYPWYEWQPPPAAAVARIRRLYKDYLKEETAPPAAGTPPDNPSAPSVEHRGE